jgi:hypothetical protein
VHLRRLHTRRDHVDPRCTVEQPTHRSVGQGALALLAAVDGYVAKVLKPRNISRILE